MTTVFYEVDDTPDLNAFYEKLGQYLDRFEQIKHIAHPRAIYTVTQAIEGMWKFCRGELDTNAGAKIWFKQLTKLAEEVGDMDEAQSAYALALAEVAHAAAHLGHVNLAYSRNNRTEADKEYVRLQAAYVNFGFAGADDFLQWVKTNG